MRRNPVTPISISVAFLLLGACQHRQAAVHQYDGAVVDASCGQCQFDLPGAGCDLAVRVDGAAYYVDGTSIDDHGDAHADDGLCNAVRSARVTGDVEEGRFVATEFELLPASPE